LAGVGRLGFDSYKERALIYFKSLQIFETKSREERKMNPGN
jgi:hypothetical protein